MSGIHERGWRKCPARRERRVEYIKADGKIIEAEMFLGMRAWGLGRGRGWGNIN